MWPGPHVDKIENNHRHKYQKSSLELSILLIKMSTFSEFLTTKYGFWIGLRDRKDQTFQWEDRSDVKYIKWQNSEPQGFTPYKQGCTYIGFKVSKTNNYLNIQYTINPNNDERKTKSF